MPLFAFIRNPCLRVRGLRRNLLRQVDGSSDGTRGGVGIERPSIGARQGRPASMHVTHGTDFDVGTWSFLGGGRRRDNLAASLSLFLFFFFIRDRLRFRLRRVSITRCAPNSHEHSVPPRPQSSSLFCIPTYHRKGLALTNGVQQIGEEGVVLKKKKERAPRRSEDLCPILVIVLRNYIAQG
ncbi:hypothetical protein F4778DRAFT_706970 [Xylariomycetidae sp. FL2044]|nr:hypothetical protein F4778DRAFT_706970 [Xylariomycetidae sp. FL2044]